MKAWAVRSIEDFIAKKEKPCAGYTFPPSAEGRVPYILLHGNKCAKRKKDSPSYMHGTPQPLRASLGEFLNDEVLERGVTVGLRYGAGLWIWFDIYLSVKSPEKLLCYSVDATPAKTWVEVEDLVSGGIRILEFLKLNIPDLFDGRQISLYSSLHASFSECPDLFAYLQKDRIEVLGGSWRCFFKKSGNRPQELRLSQGYESIAKSQSWRERE